MHKYVVKYVNRDKNLSRGIRNNNPGNIRCGSTKWLGLSNFQNDSEFCQFDTMEYGVRALLVLLRTYYNKYHCVTIKKVISRFAPLTENNTEKYIKFVSSYMAVPSDLDFSLSFCLFLAIPIMKYESGFLMSAFDLRTIIDKYNLCKCDF